jgi:hypothetical protein
MRILCSFVFTMSFMQKQCYAFASRSISKSVSAPWGSFRGGGCSSNANRALGTSTTKLEALSKQEKSFTSIAGSLPHREFGGLSFRESADEFRVVFVLGGPGAGKVRITFYRSREVHILCYFLSFSFASLPGNSE